MQAESEPFLLYIYKSLGIRYTLLLPLTAMMAFVAVLLLAMLMKRKGATYWLACAAACGLPILAGVVSVIDGLWMIQSFTSGAFGPVGQAAIAEGTAAAWVGLPVSLVLTIPAVLTAIAGGLLGNRKGDQPHAKA